MKIIEPISSALLITGCAYAAGVAQNAAFMRVFGINPAFSQPAIDKIFYDGGLVTFQVFTFHLLVALVASVAVITLGFLVVLAISRLRKKPIKEIIYIALVKARLCFSILKRLSSAGSMGYLILLAFSTYDQAQEDGKKIAEVFINTCHAVVLKKEEEKTLGCAFSKDRDSIWYYTTENDPPQTNSKLLSELDQITYLDPIKLE